MVYLPKKSLFNILFVELEEKNEVWVTSALTDADALQVITLGISLKTFGPSRKICILISECVSQTFK